jgi:hypothetical protein
MDYQTIYPQVYCSVLQTFLSIEGKSNPQSSKTLLSGQPVSKEISEEFALKITGIADFHTMQILKHLKNNQET